MAKPKKIPKSLPGPKRRNQVQRELMETKPKAGGHVDRKKRDNKYKSRERHSEDSDEG